MSEEKPLGNSKKTPQKHLGDEQLPNNTNFKHFARGRWLVVGDTLFDFREKGILNHVQFSVAMLLHRWCYNNYKLGNFEMSRRELAKIANCGDKQAQDALRVLVQYCLLDEVYLQKGAHSLYRWNVDNIVDNNSNLGRIDPTPGSGSIRHLGWISSGPESERPNTYIKEYITLVFVLRVRAYLSGHVENFSDGADAPRLSENFTVAVPARSLDEEVMTSWEDAIALCCRAYGYDRTLLVIKNHPIRFDRTPDPRKALARLCRDSGLISELRERFPHFKTNKDFATFASKDYARVLRLYHGESLNNAQGGENDATEHAIQ